MKIIPNAARTAWRSYSLWLNRAAFLMILTPEILFYFFKIDTDPKLWWIVGVALYLAVEASRYIDQNISRSPAIVLILAILMAAVPAPPPQAGQPVVSEREFLAVATPLVAKWEGKKNIAYLDTIASPPVWTVCYGETRGVKQGDRYSDAQCAAMLGAGLLTYRNGLHRYFTPKTKASRLTPERDAAYVSLAYNAGIRGIGRSTATRRLNAGDIAGGCTALGWWNKAGGRVIRGLINRRVDETRLCRMGLT